MRTAAHFRDGNISAAKSLRLAASMSAACARLGPANRRILPMRFASLLALVLLTLSGCLSISSSHPPPPESTTTIVVPSR
jgi:hypothetical protein